MARWEVQEVAKNENFTFSKYVSPTQYQVWYNQIFAGFLMNVDDF